MPFAQRLARLQVGIATVVETHRPTEAAVEAPFHGVSARSALQLAHARGVVLAVLGSAAVAVHEYAPAAIKKTVTGNGRAEKRQVQAMVARLVTAGEAAERPDVADAVAAALCHLFGSARATALAKAGAGSPRR